MVTICTTLCGIRKDKFNYFYIQRLLHYTAITGFSFYVLLTVHLGIILVNNKLDAHFFFLLRLFQFSKLFEQHSVHHQENKIVSIQLLVYVTMCRRPSGIQVGKTYFSTCVLDGHLHIVTYTRCCIATVDSPDDEHCAARNM